MDALHVHVGRFGTAALAGLLFFLGDNTLRVWHSSKRGNKGPYKSDAFYKGA